MPQPARERRVSHPQPPPEPDGDGTDAVLRRPQRLRPSPTRRSRRAGDTRNYTIIQTNGGTGTLLASQVAALNLSGDGRRLLAPQGSVEWHDRHVQRRAERAVRDLLQPVLGLVPDVPHALPQRGLGRRDDRRDLHLSALRERELPELRHVPRGTWLERADARVQLGHHGVAGRPRLHRSATAGCSRSTTVGPARLAMSRRAPSRQGRRSGRRPSRSSPSSDNLRGGRRRRPGHPHQSSTG